MCGLVKGNPPPSPQRCTLGGQWRTMTTEWASTTAASELEVANEWLRAGGPRSLLCQHRASIKKLKLHSGSGQGQSMGGGFRSPPPLSIILLGWSYPHSCLTHCPHGELWHPAFVPSFTTATAAVAASDTTTILNSATAAACHPCICYCQHGCCQCSSHRRCHLRCQH